jgi:hypothetical protein
VHDEWTFAFLIRRFELVHAHTDVGDCSFFRGEAFRVSKTMGVFGVFSRIDAQVLHVVVVTANDESHVGRAIVARSWIDRRCDGDVQHAHSQGQGRYDGIEHASSTQRKPKLPRFEV